MRITKHYFGRAISGILVVSLGGYATGAHAQEQSRALDNVSIWLGGYYANSDTNIGAHSKDGVARGNLNLEDDLDFQKRKVAPRARLDFVFGEHQGFTFDYYNIDRDHSRTISQQRELPGQPVRCLGPPEGQYSIQFRQRRVPLVVRQWR